MITLPGLCLAGEQGQLKVDQDGLEFQGSAGSSLVLRHARSSFRGAELASSRLQVLLQSDTTLSFDGTIELDPELLENHFKTYFGITIVHKGNEPRLSHAVMDAMLVKLEECADRVDEAPPASVRRRATEGNLLKVVEDVRDLLDEAVRGDKQHLNQIFAAQGCERIGRLRLVIDTVRLEVNHSDQRWVHIRELCESIEAILRDLGTFNPWQPAQAESSPTMMRRHRLRDHSPDLLREGPFAAEKQDSHNIQASTASMDVDDAGFFVSGPGADYEDIEAQYSFPSMLLSGTSPDDVESIASTLPEASEKIRRARKSSPASLPGHQVTVDPLRALQRASAAPGGESQNRQGSKSSRSSKNDLLQELLKSERSMELARQRASSLPGDRSESEVESETQPPGYAMKSAVPRFAQRVLQGWLWKKSRFLQHWRRRWVVLGSTYLATYQDQGSMNATECFPASSIQNVGSSFDPRQSRVFCIRVEMRDVFFVCEDEREKEIWRQAVYGMITRRRQQPLCN
eukprot:TRINITY_DN50489_c0_g1_i1.p1 TRINITY_DN50489_c0_g1~~TRINITY_DN50489_c0_g1_i1.p1  ORF type:complete len:515 (-),score=108.44 TRINITY_DN50489_c0_g1_i1:53-1597(-)